MQTNLEKLIKESLETLLDKKYDELYDLPLDCSVESTRESRARTEQLEADIKVIEEELKKYGR